MPSPSHEADGSMHSPAWLSVENSNHEGGVCCTVPHLTSHTDSTAQTCSKPHAYWRASCSQWDAVGTHVVHCLVGASTCWRGWSHVDWRQTAIDMAGRCRPSHVQMPSVVLRAVHICWGALVAGKACAWVEYWSWQAAEWSSAEWALLWHARSLQCDYLSQNQWYGYDHGTGLPL